MKKLVLFMETRALQRQKKLSDSEQTIAEIRALRWELSKKIKTYEDVKTIEKNMFDLRQSLKSKK